MTATGPDMLPSRPSARAHARSVPHRMSWPMRGAALLPTSHRIGQSRSRHSVPHDGTEFHISVKGNAGPSPALPVRAC